MLTARPGVKASYPTLSSCQHLTAAALVTSARTGSMPFSGDTSARASATRGGSSPGRVPSRHFRRGGAPPWCRGCPRTRHACPKPGGRGELDSTTHPAPRTTKPLGWIVQVLGTVHRNEKPGTRGSEATHPRHSTESINRIGSIRRAPVVRHALTNSHRSLSAKASRTFARLATSGRGRVMVGLSIESSEGSGISYVVWRLQDLGLVRSGVTVQGGRVANSTIPMGVLCRVMFITAEL